MIFSIFRYLNLQKGSPKGNITLKKTLFDRQMVKNHNKNDNRDHELPGFTFEMSMSITSKCYQKFMSELPFVIDNHALPWFIPIKAS